jgi:hypothetical protein
MSEADFSQLLEPNGLVVDIRGIFRNTIKNHRYWSL